jgi:hypothetical protein
MGALAVRDILTRERATRSIFSQFARREEEPQEEHRDEPRDGFRTVRRAVAGAPAAALTGLNVPILKQQEMNLIDIEYFCSTIE